MLRVTDHQAPVSTPAGAVVAIQEFLRSLRIEVGILFLAAALAASWTPAARAGKQTVCTVTINSADEKEVLRRRLPEDRYEIVELVERGRPDWLASACRRGVRCDLLVISGHFDGGTEFYSDRLNARESLPMAELERASCSASCPGVFAQLKEVYLFGCNTLSALPGASASPEVERSLVRAGHSQPEAGARARALDQYLGESNRDQMRRVFMNVPVIYGFPARAPLGSVAATHLDRFFDSSPVPAMGTGNPNPRLVSQFAGASMTYASGLNDSDPEAAHRREVCEFVDERLSPAEKLEFIHTLLRRDMADVRIFLERMESLFASLNASDRHAPASARVLDEIARDEHARGRFLRFAEDADLPQTRARMIRLAGALGWLSPDDERTELVRMVGDLIARGSIGAPEVALICSLNDDGGLDQDSRRLNPSSVEVVKAGNAAALACLGSATGHARVLKALTSRDREEVEIAQVYFGHRPITDVDELRVVARGITRMTESATQVRALDMLAQQRLGDRQSLDELARLFPAAASLDVQRAIAAVFIRADDRAIARPEFARVLAQHRLKSPDGSDIIDILIRRLRSP